MRLALGMAVAIAAAGCGPSLKRCTDNAACGAGYHCEQEVCVVNADGGAGGGGGSAGGGGGSAGGGGGSAAGGGSAGGGGGGSGGGAATCAAPCPASSECVAAVCRPRYASLTLSGPSRTAAPNALLTAQLTLATGRTAADPATLALAAVTPDGGAAIDVLMRVDAGVYATAVVLPAEGPWAWTAAFVDAGLMGTKTVVVDRTPPVIAVVVPAPPVRTSTPALTEIDPGAVGAFRRDERAPVRFDGGSACDAGPFCRDVEVDFALSEMAAYRQTFGVSARAVDDVGNPGPVADGGQALVTRWKWAVTLSGSLGTVLPAIDEAGNLVVSVPAAGFVGSFAPTGALRWTTAGTYFPAVVGAGKAPTVWLAGPSQNGVFADDGGTPAGVSWLPPGPLGFPVLALTRAPSDSVVRETGMVVVDDVGPRPFGYRWGAPQPTLVTPATNSLVTTYPVLTGDRLWVRDVGKIVPYRVRLSGLDQFEAVTPEIADTDPTEESLLATPSYLVRTGHSPVTGRTEVSAYSLVDGGLQWQAERTDAGTGGEFLSPLLGAGDSVFVVQDLPSSPGELCRTTVGQSSWQCTGGTASAMSAALGEGGLIYVSTSAGLEVRRQSDLVLIWTGPAASSQLLMTLDCSRDSAGAKLVSRPGVLYGQAGTLLLATVVDSRGVDATAPWPLLRHDPRNTANTATSLAPFSCP